MMGDTELGCFRWIEQDQLGALKTKPHLVPHFSRSALRPWLWFVLETFQVTVTCRGERGELSG